MPDRRSWNWSTIAEALRWRGPLVVLLIALREICRPLVYWHSYYIFETNLARDPLPKPHPDDKIDLVLYPGEDPERGKAEIVAMGQLEAAEVDTRFRRGDQAALAYAEGEPVGYEWLTFTNGALELAFGVTWIVGPGEGVRYDKFVLPKWRGRKISTWLHTATVTCARDHGTLRTFASISKVNKQSLGVARYYRRTPAMTVTLVHVRGLNRIFRKAVGAPFESRFSLPS